MLVGVGGGLVVLARDVGPLRAERVVEFEPLFQPALGVGQDCFYEGDNMLVINPSECIDCGVCEPECPVEAIKPDTEPGVEDWLKLNAEYAKTWPNITVKRDPPADAKEWEGKPDKIKLFDPEPGEGD